MKMEIKLNAKEVVDIIRTVIKEVKQEEVKFLREIAPMSRSVNGQDVLNLYADQIEETLKELYNDQ